LRKGREGKERKEEKQSELVFDSKGKASNADSSK
jgi:hypothetical protein